MAWRSSPRTLSRGRLILVRHHHASLTFTLSTRHASSDATSNPYTPSVIVHEFHLPSAIITPRAAGLPHHATSHPSSTIGHAPHTARFSPPNMTTTSRP